MITPEQLEELTEAISGYAQDMAGWHTVIEQYREERRLTDAKVEELEKRIRALEQATLPLPVWFAPGGHA